MIYFQVEKKAQSLRNHTEAQHHHRIGREPWSKYSKKPVLKGNYF